MADRFKVSRTPVREALHRLVAIGLATFRPNSGFRVRSIPRGEYLEAMLIRSRLEGLAAERAVARITHAQLAELKSMVDELEDIGRQLSHFPVREGSVEDQNRWSRRNEEFHNFLVHLADCPPLAAAMSTTVQAYPREVTWQPSASRACSLSTPVTTTAYTRLSETGIQTAPGPERKLTSSERSTTYNWSFEPTSNRTTPCPPTRRVPRLPDGWRQLLPESRQQLGCDVPSL